MKKRNLTRTLAKRLLKEKKAAGSWRNLQEEKYPNIPARTLWRIAMSGGEYIPQNLQYRESLGIGSLPCPTCQHRVTTPRKIRRYHSIQDLTPSELQYVFDNREPMT